MSQSENKNPSAEELLALFNTLIKENEFLRFENDTLIKQNKLHIAVFEKQHQRIENINRFNKLLNRINSKPESKIEENASKNESKLSGNEEEQSNNESNSSENEKYSSENEKYTPENEMKHSNNESNQSFNESIQTNNESIQTNNESNQTNNESNQTNNESNQTNNESIQTFNESNQTNNESKSTLNIEEDNHDEIYFIIREKLGKKFGKKYINKVLSRFADELFYINKNEKIRVEQLQNYTETSFPAIMRDIQFLKKHQWIEKVGPHKGGHYTLTKNGKELCEKELK